MHASAGAGEGGAGGVDGAGHEADQQLVHQPAEAALEAHAAGDGVHVAAAAPPALRRRFQQLFRPLSDDGRALLRRRKRVSPWPLIDAWQAAVGTYATLVYDEMHGVSVWFTAGVYTYKAKYIHGSGFKGGLSSSAGWRKAFSCDGHIGTGI
jgi:hypothetical protein